MAGRSNAGILALKQEDLEYLAAANAIVSNIVSVKLSCDRNYHLWEMQMLCLLESFNMLDVVFDRPTRKEYDCLVKGWIFGSICEDLLGTVVDLSSAKEVWEKLKSNYNPAMISSEQEGCAESAQTKLEVKTESKEKDVVSKEKEAEDIDVDLREMQTENNDAASTKAKTRKTEAQGKNAVPVEKEAASKEKEAEDIDVDLRETQTQNNDSASRKAKTRETEAQEKNAIPVEKEAKGKDISTPIERKGERTSSTAKDIKDKGSETKGKNKIEPTEEDKIERNKKLRNAILEGDWLKLQSVLTEHKDAITQSIYTDGNTVLHLAVGIGRNYFVKHLLGSIEVEELPTLVNVNRSTALHIAAIVGNTEAAMLLIRRNKDLLDAQDKDNKTPLYKAYENMHLDTIEYLLDETYQNTHLDTEHNGQTEDDGKTKDDEKTKDKGKTKDNGQTKDKTSGLENSSPDLDIGVKLLVNAISSKKYDLAKKLVEKYSNFSVKKYDEVLMAMARTFPSGLDYWETLMYPMLDPICKKIVNVATFMLLLLVDFYETMSASISVIQIEGVNKLVIVQMVLILMLGGPVLIIWWIGVLIRLLLLIVYFPLFMLYFLLWKVATRLFAPIHRIENKKKEWKEAKVVLKLVCDAIEKSKIRNAHSHFYTGPILEAARQNAFDVVDEILMRSPEAIEFIDENGYDMIQLAIINRSEKIYNLIHIIGERKNVYRTFKDDSKNNMLHLAGRLAPSQMLKRSIGAAFQLQRELQWREEVKELVFPTFVIEENIFKETPDMVFTQAHENLVKEGEKWMKAVAESCSITAGLIITIVFAAALTVPGGSNENNGIPLFAEDIAFTIFAVSDAMSLFASTTALLMFLSILTGRFAEQDFLFRLPKRLIIGLCTLMLSTTAMMVAFGSTLFLVFCNKRPWMLGPICVSAFLPIAAFATLQMPLIVDLFRSTYVRIFSTRSTSSSHRFNPNDIRLFFGK